MGAAALPGREDHIVGSKVPATIRALAAPDLLVTGYVPDVEPYFTGCRLSIAPLRYGAGVKGKVNLAMSYGVPVIATPAAVEGMHLEPGEDVLVADDPRHLPRRSCACTSDEALWQRLPAAARTSGATSRASGARADAAARARLGAAGVRCADTPAASDRRPCAPRPSRNRVERPWQRFSAGGRRRRGRRGRASARAPRTWSAAGMRAAARSRRRRSRAAAPRRG